MSLSTSTRVATVALAVAAIAVLAVSVAGGSTTRSRAGETATFALGAGVTPDFIFPIVDGAHYSVANIEQFQRLMWRPLYLYGKNGQPVLNEPASLAQTPVFSKGN